jgi:uncharacterized damage-inducible protein DinB
MESVRQLANHVERTVTGPMWHGPSLEELLVGITAADAAARPIAETHTIWELVLHIAFWADEALARFNGRARAELHRNEDWPASPEPTEEAWREARENLARSYRALREAVAASSDDMLSRRVAGADPPHSMLAMIHGVIEHGAYHGGQIALLRRAGLRATSPS